MLVILAVCWVLCCLFVYPLLNRQQSRRLYEHERQLCFVGQHQETMDHCLWVAEVESGINDWSLTAFYRRESWRLALILAAVPLLAYGCYRVALAKEDLTRSW
jgi:hypothetical protein